MTTDGSYVVVVIEADQAAVRTYGDYDSEPAAEAARRRLHMEAMGRTGHHQKFPGRAPRTYVCAKEAEPR